MKATKTHVDAFRLSALAAIAATLAGAAGCDDSVTAPRTSPGYEHAQVSTAVYPDFASAAQDVWVEVQFSNGGAGSALRATVTWDLARFRFVEALGGGDMEIVAGGADDGWMSILAAGLDDHGQITLRFEALADGETSRIAADAYFVPVGEPDDPINDGTVWS